MNPALYSVTEVCQKIGLSQEMVISWIEQEWISPHDSQLALPQFDDEDYARMLLILDLRDRLGVNEEAIPVILHLVDQLHYLRNQMQNHTQNRSF